MKILSKALQAIGISRSKKTRSRHYNQALVTRDPDSASALLDRMIDASFQNPKGFRTPSIKTNRNRMPTAMEQLAFSSNMTDELGVRERSDRGKKKARAMSQARQRQKLYAEALAEYRQIPGVSQFAAKLPRKTYEALRAKWLTQGRYS